MLPVCVGWAARQVQRYSQTLQQKMGSDADVTKRRQFSSSWLTSRAVLQLRRHCSSFLPLGASTSASPVSRRCPSADHGQLVSSSFPKCGMTPDLTWCGARGGVLSATRTRVYHQRKPAHHTGAERRAPSEPSVHRAQSRQLASVLW